MFPRGEGSFHAFAIVTDATGIQGQSAPEYFSINSPEVSLAAQVGPVSAPNAVLLTATPSDADGPEDLASVKFYIGGILIPGSEQTTAPWTCSYVPTAAGNYQATAIVRDKFGLETTSAPASFSVHAPQTTAAVSPLMWEAPGYVVVSASPTDADGASNLSHVNFFIDSTWVGAASAPPWTAEASGLAAGTHSLVAVAVDRFGLTGSSSTQTFTIHPAEGATDTDGDGIPDWWEDLYSLNSTDPTDATQDWLGDGVTNLTNYWIGRRPLVAVVTDSTGLTGLQVHTPLE